MRTRIIIILLTGMLLLPVNQTTSIVNVESAAQDTIPWIKYADNPVFGRGTGEDFDTPYIADPAVILVDGVFRMYYVGGGDIGYAESVDGITWIRRGLTLERGPDAFDSDHLADPTVVFSKDLFHMWYTAWDEEDVDSIGYATSTNGLSWDKRGPVNLERGSFEEFDSAFLGSPTVVYHEDSWHMWYAGHTRDRARVGYATSQDGIIWTKRGMVLDRGEEDDFDSYSVTQPEVSWRDGLFHMYYCGIEGVPTAVRRIGYATSEDGATWVKHGTAVELGDTSDWDDWLLKSPSVILGNTDRMWYVGRARFKEGMFIGYAERNTPPQIDHPVDLGLEADSTGHQITWNSHDDDSSWYIVTVHSDLVTQGPWEGYLVEQGSWDGSSISVTIDGLAPGTYTYELVVVDGAGQSTSDQVEVVVIPATTDLTTPKITTSVSEFPTQQFWALFLSIGALIGWNREKIRQKLKDQ